MLTLMQEMTDKKGTTFLAGGATQNSIRFAQWLLQAPGASTYIGSVGKDKYGDILKESMDKAGVKVYVLPASQTHGLALPYWNS